MTVAKARKIIEGMQRVCDLCDSKFFPNVLGQKRCQKCVGRSKR